MTWHASPKAPTFGAALEKGMPFPAGCVGVPHHLFQVTWDALYPSNLGCSTTSPRFSPCQTSKPAQKNKF